MIINTRLRNHIKDLYQISSMQTLGRLPTPHEEFLFFYRNRGALEAVIESLDSLVVNLAENTVKEIAKNEKNSSD